MYMCYGYPLSGNVYVYYGYPLSGNVYVCYGYPLSGNVYVYYGYPLNGNVYVLWVSIVQIFLLFYYYILELFQQCCIFLFFILFYFQFCVDGSNVNKAVRRFSFKLNVKNQVTYNNYRTEWIELGHACIIKTAYDSPLACSLGATASCLFHVFCPRVSLPFLSIHQTTICCSDLRVNLYLKHQKLSLKTALRDVRSNILDLI